MSLLNTCRVIDFSKEVDQIHEELMLEIKSLIEKYTNIYGSLSGKLNDQYLTYKGRDISNTYTDENRRLLRIVACSLVFLVDYRDGVVWDDNINKVAHSQMLFASYDILDKFRLVASERCIWYGEYEIEF